MRQHWVIGNWKMNGGLAANQTLLAGVRAAAGPAAPVRLGVCAPFPYLLQCQQALDGSGVVWGAQDLSAEIGGAFTGEVCGAMLTDFDCGIVIVGHSERRLYHGESEVRVAEKALRAVENGIRPVFCIGETQDQHDAGETEAVLARQLMPLFALLNETRLAMVIVAYEPVWAIGTGKTPTPEDAQAVHRFIRARLADHSAALAEALPVIYGGSVKSGNAASLFAQPDIDGGLIGGASLDAGEFLAIAKAAHG
ncbi:triose-phosphate isomerase [Jeongeupia naejangsanensis]|uniref:Triosephosphate isomerase n=1 Tax=Jeongeupia naejangsanensis TaxID=613195 RepID=A0ABS2BL88_9NEIS|nr:triose-phosphate isomerase [Jeongeupia naejangsanensis]MBM3116225.1 triose-phosphate isomerase [Jeongeupia naejangsanensis]